MSVKRHYEIQNPSDKVIVTTANELAACIAVLLLGEGKYGLVRDDGVQVLPIFFMGGHDEWLAINHQVDDLSAWMRVPENGIAMAEVLESVFYGSVAEHKALSSALELMTDHVLRDALRVSYNASKQTSMNNIAQVAAHYAHLFRKIATAPTPATAEGAA